MADNHSAGDIFKTLQVMRLLSRPNLIVDSVQPEDTLIIHSLISLHTRIMIDKHLYIHLWSQPTDRTMQALLPPCMQCQRQQKLEPGEPEVLRLAFLVHVMTMTKCSPKCNLLICISHGATVAAVARPRLRLDLFDGHFFGAMEWLMFFSSAPSVSMVFQWFCQR